jgi:hypothetical protein
VRSRPGAAAAYRRTGAVVLDVPVAGRVGALSPASSSARRRNPNARERAAARRREQLRANRPDLLNDYVRWHHLQVHTRDIDPVYPVLRRLVGRLQLTWEQAAWLVLLHVAYYHLGSALAAFAAVPKPGPPTDRLLRLPTGTERRGHRVPDNLRTHWLSLLAAFDAAGGISPWLLARGTAWGDLNDQITTVAGNGRWAAYKTAELAQKVLDVPTTVADAGHANSTGPRQGLALLHDIPDGNSPAVIARLDTLTRQLARRLGEDDIGQVETSLCDFHSLVGGGYYLGHDIDAMAEQLVKVPSDLTPVAFDARGASLPARYLAEQTGRPLAVDRDRKRVYQRTGRILQR